MMSPIHLAHPARRPSILINSNPNANLNHLIGLSFAASKTPQQKGGFLQKKVIPVIRRVGAVAGKVSDVAGKVAVVASIL
jgi:hypothetical protein